MLPLALRADEHSRISALVFCVIVSLYITERTKNRSLATVVRSDQQFLQVHVWTYLQELVIVLRKRNLPCTRQYWLNIFLCLLGDARVIVIWLTIQQCNERLKASKQCMISILLLFLALPRALFHYSSGLLLDSGDADSSCGDFDHFYRTLLVNWRWVEDIGVRVLVLRVELETAANTLFVFLFGRRLQGRAKRQTKRRANGREAGAVWSMCPPSATSFFFPSSASSPPPAIAA